MLKKNPKNLVYLLIFILPFLLFFVSPQFFTSLKFNTVDWTSGPIRMISFPFSEFKKILYYHRIYDEYKRLNEEVGVLKTRLIGLEEVIHENTRLQKLLEFKRGMVYASIAANVIGRESSLWNSSMIIDKGKLDGVKQGQPVINASGVVGKIAEVGVHVSKVILLTDPQFSVAGLIQGSRESALVTGALQGNVCRLRYFNTDADIQIGEEVITSRLSTSFPESLLIGKIISKQEGAGREPEYLVEPAVSLSQIEEVLIIQKW